MSKPMPKNKQLSKNTSEKITQKRFRKCKYCGEKKVPYGAIQPFCWERECIKAHNKKTEAKKKREALKKMNSQDKKYLRELAQKEVNRYIRIRDKNKPCISCGAVNYRQEAGHYRSAGNNGAIRYHTLNIFSQCHKCNCRMSANLIPYRENLVVKIGIERVEWLESQTHPKDYSVDYLVRLISVFRKKIKLMEKRA